MDTKQNAEYKMISEFISKTGATADDALACLKTWGWDMRRALTDYNDTCTIDFIEDEEGSSRDNVMVNPSYKKENNKSTPIFTKQDSIDMIECKKLYRGISRATDNVGIVSRARCEIAKDIYKSMRKNMENTNNFQYSVDTPDSTFILPNIFNYPEDFRTFIEKDLIETSTLNALEQAQRLNWWVDANACRKLWPLATTGDGNCLLHAASLGMWGFHDRKLTLRTALYSVLSDGKFKDALRRRWRFQQTQLNKKAGFVYSEAEWAKEWDDIISMASPEPRRSMNHHHNSENNDYKRKSIHLDRNSLTESEMLDNNPAAAVYESLEEIHILALAHVLRRTIIVISDTVLKDLHGEAMAPITFGGIYLPFEIDSKECNRGPLLLAYDMAHFSALVPMENGSDYPPFLVPLTDSENILLPIQFCIDPGEAFDWKSYNGNEENWILTEREHIALLKEYLDIVYVTTNRSPDDEICEDLDDDFEKKFIESEIIIPTTSDYITNISEEANNNNNNGNNNAYGKSKASRQLQSVAKQFGSIGKNMSRKLKKNIGSIAKFGGKNLQKKNSLIMGGTSSSSQPYTCCRILCARLRVKRHDYQEEMIRNYIECAQSRFIEAEKNKEQKTSTSGGVLNVILDDDASSSNNRKLETLSVNENDNSMTQNNSRSICINAGCNQFATSDTSYLCPECFEKQKKHENLQFFNSSPRYGTGNSKFYTQADIQSHDSIRKLPSLRKLNELDQTLYLSNSTFYNDVLPSYSEAIERSNKESQRYMSSTSHQSSSSPSSSSSSTYDNIMTAPQITVGELSSTARSDADNRMCSAEHDLLISNVSSPSSVSVTKPCKTLGCPFYGNSSTNWLCSKCQKTRINQELNYHHSAFQSNPLYATPSVALYKSESKITSDI